MDKKGERQGAVTLTKAERHRYCARRKKNDYSAYYQAQRNVHGISIYCLSRDEYGSAMPIPNQWKGKHEAPGD